MPLVLGVLGLAALWYAWSTVAGEQAGTTSRGCQGVIAVAQALRRRNAAGWDRLSYAEQVARIARAMGRTEAEVQGCYSGSEDLAAAESGSALAAGEDWSGIAPDQIRGVWDLMQQGEIDGRTWTAPASGTGWGQVATAIRGVLLADGYTVPVDAFSGHARWVAYVRAVLQESP